MMETWSLSDPNDTPASRKRQKGRPARHDPGVGRERIIAGTVDLLRARRPAEITRHMVAAHVGVDPKLVHYYFGDLDTLLDTALEQIVSELSHTMAVASAAEASPEAVMRGRIAALTRFFLRNPYAWQMLAARVYESDSAWAASLGRALNTTGFGRLEALVKRGRHQKAFSDTFDERLLYVALIGLSEIFVTARPVVDIIAPDLDPAEAEQRYIDLIADLVLHGICAPPRRPRSSLKGVKVRSA